jgi:lipopolysaccharide transport system permease protein
VTDPVSTAAGGAMSVALIRPSSGWKPIDGRELWRYRELLWFLAQRDLKVRYKQTVLGIAWAVLQPLLTMAVLVLFFGRLGGLQNQVHGIPYSMFVLSGLLIWQLFAQSLAALANCLVSHQALLTKVYFPRLILPLSVVAPSIVDFGVALVLLLLLMVWHRLAFPATIALVPVLMLFALLASLAVGLGLAALNVEYRDARHALPFFVQLWMFATPIAYPGRLVPQQWRVLYGLNPMAGLVEAFRWALLRQPPPPLGMLVASIAATVLLLIVALVYFRRTERTLADVV